MFTILSIVNPMIKQSPDLPPKSGIKRYNIMFQIKHLSLFLSVAAASFTFTSCGPTSSPSVPNPAATKALKAVETTVIFEKKGLMDTAQRPLQKSYLKLKNLGLTQIFNFTISKFKGVMERNFLSEKPNLFWFDLYRLSYYIDLKSKKDA